MKLLVLIFFVTALGACAAGSGRGSSAKPPATKVAPVKDTVGGVEVVDNYRWLEGDNTDPANRGKTTAEVDAWTKEQNDYTRATLDALPGRAAVEARLRELMEVGDVGAPTVRGNRYFYRKREGAQNQAVVYWREGYKGADKTLIDPAKLDDTNLTTVEWIAPSEDGKLLAYGTYRQGDENTTLHVLDVDTGKVQPTEIPDKTQAPSWLPDSSGFLYQNLKNPKDPYTGQILFHKMGTDRKTDRLVTRQFTKDENAKLATTWGPFGYLSRDGHWLILGYWIDTKSNDLWVANFDEFLKTGKVNKRVIAEGGEGQSAANVIGHTLIVQTTKGAPKGKIVSTDVSNPGQAHWKTIVPERADAVIQGVSYGKGVFAVTYMKKACNEIEVFDLTGKSLGLVNQPGIGSSGISTEEDRTEAYLTFTSFNYPTSIFRVDLSKPATAGELWAQPPVPVDPKTVEVEQVTYPSKDGTPITMFLVHKKGLVKNGQNPTILDGYGGFNVSVTPVFRPTMFEWFEMGGLYATPNLRGGGEYGDDWHEAGMLAKKQNVFDDFIAAAEWLIANKYTSTPKLAVYGGSNGGLLTGAVVTQRPDLIQAAIVAVPLLDMLRYQDFLMARYWVPEYGAAENADQAKFLLAYSPYQHVKQNTKYPAVLLTAGEHDSRVHPSHARKMAAAMQAATTSDPASAPILLWVDMDAGHGQGKPLNLRVREVADQRAFLMWQLGMK